MTPERRVLVTGGSGFIGTNLLAALTSAGCSVLNVDTTQPRDPRQGAFWRPGSVLDESFLLSTCEEFGPTHCVHLAAETDMLDTADIEGGFPVNVHAAPRLMEALAKVSCRHVIMTSTQFVCGPKASPPATATSYAPHTAYGASKVRMEDAVRRSATDTPWTIVRPTYVWGPWHLERFLELVRTIASRRYMHPAGPPVVRSYGYVSTVVEQIVSLLGNSDAHGRTLYLGEAPVDSREFVDALSREFTGQPVRTVPRALLRAASMVGDHWDRIPLDGFRYRNLTTDYRVSMDETFELVGRPAIALPDAARRFGVWLRWYDRHANEPVVEGRA